MKANYSVKITKQLNSGEFKEVALLFISQKGIENMIEALFPDKGIKGISKSYVELINFINRE